MAVRNANSAVAKHLSSLTRMSGYTDVSAAIVSQSITGVIVAAPIVPAPMSGPVLLWSTVMGSLNSTQQVAFVGMGLSVVYVVVAR